LPGLEQRLGEAADQVRSEQAETAIAGVVKLQEEIIGKLALNAGVPILLMRLMGVTAESARSDTTAGLKLAAALSRV